MLWYMYIHVYMYVYSVGLCSLTPPTFHMTVPPNATEEEMAYAEKWSYVIQLRYTMRHTCTCAYILCDSCIYICTYIHVYACTYTCTCTSLCTRDMNVCMCTCVCCIQGSGYSHLLDKEVLARHLPQSTRGQS